MKYLDKYDCRELEDKNLILDLIPVEDYDEIFVCVSPRDEYIVIYDGGSVVAELKTVYNFSSKEFLDKLVEICKKYRVSKNGNVFFLQCQKDEFDQRLNDFVDALNQICNI